MVLCRQRLVVAGLQRFADALGEFDPNAAKKYHQEAASFRDDLRRVVREEAILSPVRLGRDGAYHSYLPRMAYAAGLTGPELGAPQFPDVDYFMGALPLAEPFAALEASDARVGRHRRHDEEMGTSVAAVGRKEEVRRQKGLAGGGRLVLALLFDAAEGLAQCQHLPAAGRHSQLPAVLDELVRHHGRSNGKLWEPWHPGSYTECTDPDNGTAGWFLENFRNLLVMEDGPVLWIARGTPRAWLKQDGEISYGRADLFWRAGLHDPLGRGAPEDHGNRRDAEPDAAPEGPGAIASSAGAPIKSVTVNGRPWTAFDARKEVVEIQGLVGHVEVVGSY